MLTVTVLIGFIFLIQPCGIFSENISYLCAFLYRIRTAIFCDAFYNDKWVGNLFYVQQNLSVNMRCKMQDYFVFVIIIAITMKMISVLWSQIGQFLVRKCSFLYEKIVYVFFWLNGLDADILVTELSSCIKLKLFLNFKEFPSRSSSTVFCVLMFSSDLYEYNSKIWFSVRYYSIPTVQMSSSWVSRIITRSYRF